MTSRKPDNPLTFFSTEDRAALAEQRLSRRSFIQHPARIAAGTTAATLLGVPAGAAQVATPEAEAEVAIPIPPVEVPDTPSGVPPDEFTILTSEEVATLEALLRRMLPGDEEDPGAVEAGVAIYIDRTLATNQGFHERIYRDGPWARPYEGDTPPPDEENVIWVPVGDMERYGYQSPLTPLQVYRSGLELTNQHAKTSYGGPMAGLSDTDQHAVVWDLVRNDVPGFTQFSGHSFFQTLRHHIAQGMFSDPAYGGNRGLAGWTLVGFPGAQRSFLPSEIRGTSPPRAPQAMSELPHFHTGDYTDEPNVVLPVRGTEPDESEP